MANNIIKSLIRTSPKLKPIPKWEPVGNNHLAIIDGLPVTIKRTIYKSKPRYSINTIGYASTFFDDLEMAQVMSVAFVKAVLSKSKDRIEESIAPPKMSKEQYLFLRLKHGKPIRAKVDIDIGYSNQFIIERSDWDYNLFLHITDVELFFNYDRKHFLIGKDHFIQINFYPWDTKNSKTLLKNFTNVLIETNPSALMLHSKI